MTNQNPAKTPKIENRQRISFFGGYVEIFVDTMPIFHNGAWCTLFEARIEASDNEARATGKDILNQMGFTQNSVNNSLFQTYLDINFGDNIVIDLENEVDR